LISAPLITDKFTTIHAADRNNHFIGLFYCLIGESNDSIFSSSSLPSAFVLYASLPAIRQMTSVLYSSGLNYQGRNPMGNEMRGMDRRLTEIESTFGGVKGKMEQFLTGQSGGSNETAKKIAEMKAELDVQHASLDSKISGLKTQLDSVQSLCEVLKARVDRSDAAVASASAAAAQAKTLATAAAADAASASAAAHAAASGVSA
jgi:hypothetical protein